MTIPLVGADGSPGVGLALEIVDTAAMIVLAVVMAVEVLEPSKDLQLFNLLLFALFLALFVARVIIGEWRGLSRPWKVAEVVLLAAALPIPGFKGGPIRLLRLMRLPLLGARRARTLRQQLIDRGPWLVAVTAGAMVYIGSLFILEFEKGQGDRKFETLPDALWWAVTTMTTVGYGDLAPHTLLGRVTAVCLMIIGISLFGMVTALLAKWLMGGRPDDEPASKGDVALLRAEIARLREELMRDAG